jgi:hypothetical protein
MFNGFKLYFFFFVSLLCILICRPIGFASSGIIYRRISSVQDSQLLKTIPTRVMMLGRVVRESEVQGF